LTQEKNKDRKKWLRAMEWPGDLRHFRLFFFSIFDAPELYLSATPSQRT